MRGLGGANTSMYYNYNSKRRRYANKNRKNMTKSEACLWKYVLRNRKMLGYQFRRQRPIDWYIADFACLPIYLIIEVDGLSHQNEKAKSYDKQRDERLKVLGFTTLRFSSKSVLYNIEQVRADIEEWIRNNATVPPPLPRKRDRINRSTNPNPGTG